MRVPLSWLAEYIDIAHGVTGEQVAASLVRVGLEEEGLYAAEVSGPLLVGRVLEFADEPQTNGKTIRWCSVDVGEGQARGIVCGASNFAVDDLVVVALPGSVLVGGFEISARKTYGHVSDGMICSVRELGIGDDHAGILVLGALGLTGEPGDDAVALLGLAGETVEVNVTPDRGYCLSLRGIAREYGHATGATASFRDPGHRQTPGPTSDAFAVRVDDDAPIDGNVGCDRFVTRVVRGLVPGAVSPHWMRHRLVQAGMRPISLPVDVTNYVMLALGQPLHAYDLGALDGGIVVRRAREGERLVTLDDVDRELFLEDLLITDGEAGSRIIGMAGVMGGELTEVGPSTRDVLIEAAHFDPVSVARTARRHRLPSEASKRFERGVDPDVAAAAADLAVALLVEHGGATADPRVGDLDDRTPPTTIELPVSLPAALVGVDYPDAEVTARLLEIGCAVTGDELLTVAPPSWRPDLVQPYDLVEEVARLEGYDRIPSVLPHAPSGRGLTPDQRRRSSVSRALADSGLVEVLTYPFVSPDVHDDFGLAPDDDRRRAARLANPLSAEQPEMRTSLLATLMDALRRNVSRGAPDVGVFEIGSVTRPRPDAPPARILGVDRRPDDGELKEIAEAVPPQPLRVGGLLTGLREPAGWWGPGRQADHFDAVDAARAVAATLHVPVEVAADEHPPWHPGRCARLSLTDGTLVGHAGELHPAVLSRLELPPRTQAFELDLDVLLGRAPVVPGSAPVSTYPVALQDVALVVDASVPAADVERALVDGGGALLEQVRLFDVYSGEQVAAGRTSLAFSLRMRAPDRTLTADETAAVRTAAVAEAERRCGAVLRGA